jgi:PhoPQ-activated pathogenicity-related protein
MRLSATAVALAGAAALFATPARASPLWDYVHLDDGAFSWVDTGVTIQGGANSTGGWTGHILNVTSQKWLTPADFAGPYGHIWWHQVVVITPDAGVVYPDAAALWITGNDNDGAGTPDPSDEDILVCASLAVTVGTSCSVLYQIPNAPLIFTADPERKSRSEDAAVAFTWQQFMLYHQDQPEWILYYPMAKAGIKAMDATTQFLHQTKGQNITRWVTAGASKRGATTWLTGAVDDRIIGIVPIVFDVLNFRDGVQHMWRTLGNWTFAFTVRKNESMRLFSGTPPPSFPSPNLTRSFSPPSATPTPFPLRRTTATPTSRATSTTAATTSTSSPRTWTPSSSRRT